MRHWITEQVYIRNFNSIGSVPIVYDIKKGSSIMVGANGAGKTSLLSALLYVKYNSTVNEKPIDSVINTVNGSKTLVLEKFLIEDESSKDHNKRFVLYRGRKDNIFGVCELFENTDINLDCLESINKNSEIEMVLKEYGKIKKFSTGKLGEKQLLEQFLIIDETIFRSLVYVSGYNEDFADFKKAERSKYISNLFNINWFNELVAQKKLERKTVLGKFESIKTLYDESNIQLEVKNSEIELLTNQNIEAYKNFELEKSMLESTIKDYQKEIVGVLESKELADVISNKSNLEILVKNLEQSIIDYNEMQLTFENKTVLLKQKIDTYETSKTRIEKEIDETTKAIDNHSFDPKKDISSKEELLSSNKTKISNYNTLLSDISEKVSSLSNSKSVIASKKKTLEESKTELSKKLDIITKSKEAQEKELELFDKDTSDISSITNDVTNLKLKQQELFSIVTERQKDIDKSLEVISFYENNDVCEVCHQSIQEDFKKEIYSKENGVIKDYQEEISKKKSEMENISSDIKKKLDSVEVINKNSEELKELNSKLDEIVNTISYIENDIEALNDNDIQKLVSEFEAEKSELMKIAVDGHNDFGSEFINGKIKELEESNFSIQSEITNHEQLKKEFETLDLKLDTLINEHNLNEYPYDLEETIKIIDKKLKEFNLEDTQTSINNSNTQIEAITDTLNNVSDINHLIELEEAKKTTLSEQYMMNKKETSHIEKEVEVIKARMEEHSDEIDEMNKKLTIKDNIINLFTSEELKSSLFNHYIDLLNFYSHNITTELAMKYRVIFQPDFEVTVEGYNVSPDYKGMSGGERKQINFIVLATFHKLLTMFGNFKTNIIFLDEYIDSKLDVVNIEIMVDTCIKYFKDQSMYMVIHNDRVYSRFDNVYLIKNDIFTSMVEIDKNNEDSWQDLIQNHAR